MGKIICYIKEKSTFRNLFIFLFVISILVNLIVYLQIILSYGKIIPSPDAKLYLDIAYAIRHFSSKIIGVYNPVFAGQDIGHTIMPGYPLLISPFFENLTLIAIFQVLLFSFSLYFLFKILYQKHYIVTAFFSIIWIVLTTSWNYHNQPIIESTTISFLIIVLYFLGKYFKDYKLKDFILLAVFFGILISLNNRYIFHFCGLLVFLLFLKIFNRKILIKHILYGFLVVTLIMLPWHIRQYLVYGKVIIFSASRSDMFEKRTKKDDSLIRFQRSYAYREYLKDSTNHPLKNDPKELERCRLAYFDIQNEAKAKSNNWLPSKSQRIFYEPQKASIINEKDIAKENESILNINANSQISQKIQNKVVISKKQISSQGTEKAKEIASKTQEKITIINSKQKENIGNIKGMQINEPKSNLSKKKNIEKEVNNKLIPEIEFIQDTFVVISLKVEKEKTDTIIYIEKIPKNIFINRMNNSSQSVNTSIIYDTIDRKNNIDIYSDLIKNKPPEIAYDDGKMHILISRQNVKKINVSDFNSELEFNKFNDLRIQKLVPSYDEMIDEVLKVHPDLAYPEKLKKFMTDFSYNKYKQMVLEKPYPTRLSIIWDRFKEHFVFFRTDFRFSPQWDARIYLPSWYNHPIQMILDLLNGPFIIILFVPFIFAIKNREYWILTIGIIVLLHIILHSLLGYLPRYRVTIFPAWITFAAYGYDQIARWIIKLVKEKKLSKAYLASKFSLLKK